MFILKNYNKFLCKGNIWNDFYIHRFKQDFNKLIKFNSREEAQNYIDNNRQIEDNFDAWIIETSISEWENISIC